MFSRPTMDNLVVAFRYASLTPPAGGVDNRQADAQVPHSLLATFAYGLTRPTGLPKVEKNPSPSGADSDYGWLTCHFLIREKVPVSLR